MFDRVLNTNTLDFDSPLPLFTSSKSTIEIVEEAVKYVEHFSTLYTFFGIPITDFAQVIVCRVTITAYIHLLESNIPKLLQR